MLNTQRRGFTLIELLVVIAIIAILAAILFPVFAKAREKARQTSCLSDTKQLALGIIQYYQDYDEHFACGVDNIGKGAGWAGQIYPYVKSIGVYRCPDDASNLPGTPVSYGYNSQLSPFFANGTATDGSGVKGLALAQLNAPVKTVMFFEVINSGYYNITIPAFTGTAAGIASDLTPGKTPNYGGGSVAGYGIGNQYDFTGFNTNAAGSDNSGSNVKYATGYLGNSVNNANGNFDAATGRHSDGANYVMCDGHAKWFRGSAVSGGYENFAAAGDCGSTGTAATTTCTDNKIAATFNYM